MKRFATEATHQQAKIKAEESLKRHEHHRRTSPLPPVQVTVPCLPSTYALLKIPLEARTHTTTAGEQYHPAQLRASQDLKMVEQPTGDRATHGG